MIYWLLSDHINEAHLEGFNPDTDCVFICECLEDLAPVKHHQKKLVLLLSALRHFRHTLEKKNYHVYYVALDDPKHSGHLETELKKMFNAIPNTPMIVSTPSSFHLKKKIESLEYPIQIRENPQFLATHDEFEQWSTGYKNLRMEYFYRKMRVKYDILMDQQKPIGGQWNYDAENRKPPKAGLVLPSPCQIDPDRITMDVIDLVNKQFNDHFGHTDQFHYAVTREDALNVLDHFIHHALSYFGDYQDAMIQNQVWMFHSHISFYLNCGLLSPIECIQKAEEQFLKAHAPIAAVEGFIRQILGWREFIRGIYWLKMPEYETHNALNARQPLPEFYWTAQSPMNCMNDAIHSTIDYGYAHHIQRLMITGNYALLSGIDPTQINEWYWIVYLDAYHWVELPNVLGMAIFADNGLLGSKPYAASGAYINKMSNYCRDCQFNVKEKHGPSACPFNYLYWSFIHRHEAKFKTNPRMKFVYHQLHKIKDLPQILESAEHHLKTYHSQPTRKDS